MTYDASRLLIELGLVVVGLAVLARIASRWSISSIPFYLLAGLAFAAGGLPPLNVSAGFIHIGAEVGVLVLRVILGLQCAGEDLKANLRGGFRVGHADLGLHVPADLVPGV